MKMMLWLEKRCSRSNGGDICSNPACSNSASFGNTIRYYLDPIFMWIRSHLDSNLLRFNAIWVRFFRFRCHLDSNVLRFELTWIRFHLDSNLLGFEATWIRFFCFDVTWIRIYLDSNSLRFEFTSIRYHLDSISIGFEVICIRLYLDSKPFGFVFFVCFDITWSQDHVDSNLV